MAAREGILVLVGAGLGAGIVLLAMGRPGDGPAPVPPTVRAEGPIPGSVPAPDPIPAPTRVSPDPSTPAVPAAADPPGSRVAELELQAVRLEIDVANLALGRKGEPAARNGKGYAGNPRAGQSLDELAEDREKAAREVGPLLEKWRAAAPGAERAAAMKELSMPMYRLLEAGGSMDNLVTLEESAERGETAEERRSAVIATHRLWQPGAVDFLLARARSPHVDVRFYAVEGLAWVRGDDQSRALDGVVAGLDDPAARVRTIAAISLGTIVGDPAHGDAILERLGREEDPRAAGSMAAAVLALDPDKGGERAAKAAAKSSAEVREAVGAVSRTK